MKKWWPIIGIVIAIAVIGFFTLPGGPGGPFGGPNCSVSPGEWMPAQGECPGTTADMQNKCNEFCKKHPDCCPGQSGNGGPAQILPLPSDSVVNLLTRNYPTTIKCIDEGPLIYPQTGTIEMISNETFEKMKDTGFNTIQVLMLSKWNGDRIVFNDETNSILLNEIVAMKKNGLAVWVALDFRSSTENLSGYDYQKYKTAYMGFVNESAILMERYKVEYLTVNNEPDHFFGAMGFSEYTLEDFFPATNELAQKNFNGKLINKITQPRKHTPGVIEASFKNVDIAGVDVGPHVSENMALSTYGEEFEDYQFYATAAEKSGIPWMNAEYWLSDFGESTNYQRNNQLEYVTAPFDIYFSVNPKGVGYTYNEFNTLSWQQQGEQTRLALKEFLSKI